MFPEVYSFFVWLYLAVKWEEGIISINEAMDLLGFPEPEERHECPEGCRIPRLHVHTGIFSDVARREYFCPTEGRWVMCSGPCPDGTEHEEVRTKTYRSEQIQLIL